jgi:adenylate cyclase
MPRVRMLWRAVRQVFEGVPGRLPRRAVSAAARVLIVAAVISANVIGVLIVLTLLVAVLPVPEEAQADDPVALGISGAYALLAIAYGTARGLRLARPVVHMFEREGDPTEAERKAVVGLPAHATRLQLMLWFIGAFVFGGAAAIQISVIFGFEVACTVALAGLAVSGVTYLQFQRLLRGAVHVALSASPPRRREVPGVGLRVILAWGLSTAVPVAGALILSIFALATDDVDAGELARSTLVLSGIALLVGALAMASFARSVSDPLRRLRDAFAAVESGDLDAEVPIFDATEVGYAAAGFNRMLEGLRERERLHDLFGRQVGADVARRALEEGVTLGGEEREAAVLFVDIIGSTRFAADRAPNEVVEALNDFFATVVEVTQAHGGLVNKFAGDAALCVFGAPLAREDPAGSALAAAREMCERLRGGEFDAGIGVAAGTVVAGNIGTSDRYEYTVIGDAVNEAARLTELAKERHGRILASADAVDAAREDEAARWRLDGEVELRGRTRPTRLAEVGDA